MSKKKHGTDNLEILCPDCKALLVVDPATGHVLEHRSAKPVRTIGSFEDAFSAMKSSDESREDRFAASVAAQKKRADELSRSFEHLVRKTAEEDDGTPPPNPLGID